MSGFGPSEHLVLHRVCPLSGGKRTCPFALQMSAFDPKRTFFKRRRQQSKRRSGSAPQHVLERMDGKTGSHRALRARAGSCSGRRGRPVLQEPVLGAADGERRNGLGVRAFHLRFLKR
jgi:hypothetical protein